MPFLRAEGWEKQEVPTAEKGTIYQQSQDGVPNLEDTGAHNHES